MRDQQCARGIVVLYLTTDSHDSHAASLRHTAERLALCTKSRVVGRVTSVSHDHTHRRNISATR